MPIPEIVMTNLHFHMHSAPSPIRIYWYNHVPRQMVLHAHEFTELVMVLRGQARHTAIDVDGVCYTREVQRGDLILLRVGEQHVFEFPEGERLMLCNILYESRVLNELFCKDNPDVQALRIINEYPHRPAAMRLGQTVRADEGLLRTLSHLAVRIHDEEVVGREGSSAMQILLLGEMLTEIGRLVGELYPVKHEQDKQTLALRPVFEHIHRHYCDSVTMEELAGLVLCTPRHLSRRFKQVTGETVGEYIRRLRVSKACYLLQHTPLHTGRIARDVGYQEYAGFVRAFREELGMTPGQYRRCMREHGESWSFPNRFYVR